MRRSIDDAQVPAPAGRDDDPDVSWAVGLSDDYDDAEPRVTLVAEELGRAGEGFTFHLSGSQARRLRAAIADAMREFGEDAGR